MFIDLTPAQRALRDELRGYFGALMSTVERAAVRRDRHGPAYREVVRRMGRDGWLGVGWPAEYGGRGFGPIEQQIFVNEAARADVPLPSVTLQTVGPTLMVHGTAAQKDFFLPRILSGELHFAIGYTEPGAGTDLAALSTRAVRDGDEYVVNGQKTFTTGAHDADYIWLACRTAVSRHHGISILIVDTRDPGYSWTPIITCDGAHHVNATYFSDVRVPVAMRVGEENAGWRLVTTQLNHERVMLGPAGRLAALHERVRAWASSRDLLDRPDVRRALAESYACLRVNELLNWQVAASDPVEIADASATKVFGSVWAQRLNQSFEEIVGRHGGDELLSWLDTQAKRNLVLTFGGGVNEIQRELIATAGLSLPHAPREAPARPAPAAPPPARDRRNVNDVAVSGGPRHRDVNEVVAAGAEIRAAGVGPLRAGRDAVNLAMINNWLEAIGDGNPVYAEAGLAPPAMTQVWTMRGLHPVPDAGDPLRAMSSVLDEAGYTSVVATNCEQAYHRYLRLGERVAVRSRLTELTGPKRTALGEGWFVTTESSWYVGDELVATMLFRVLKYRPAPTAPAAAPLRPVISRDTAFFWAGCAAGELRVQRCGSCGALRHPPGPACPRCGALDPGYLVAAGVGTVYSYVVHHHPPLPGRRSPVVVALVELAEGVRVVGELLGVEPGEVHVGAPVEVAFVRVDDELTLPAWRLAGRSHVDPPAPAGSGLPELRVAATPTFVIAAAIATRDFQDVHHDRDSAVSRGARDIFVNILTTTGLVQRYVTDWAGPGAVVRCLAIRLGAPCYAYDTLTFTGRVVGTEGQERTVEVVGRGSLGTHVTGTVRISGGTS